MQNADCRLQIAERNTSAFAFCVLHSLLSGSTDHVLGLPARLSRTSTWSRRERPEAAGGENSALRIWRISRLRAL